MDDFNLIIGKRNFQTKSDPFSPSEEVVYNGNNPWDAAHRFLKYNNLDTYIEPEISSELFELDLRKKVISKSTKAKYLKTWPLPPDIRNKFVWHLQEQYSELSLAREKVVQKINVDKCIRIAHIDTGYQLGHEALPKYLDKGISFVKGEIGKEAIDTTKNSFAEQDGHGTATVCILAGNKIVFNDNNYSFKGYFGGIPFAEIIPIRISDTVAMIRSQNFVRAVEYAIQKDCEVISMSMAGAPTKEWAKVVNKAYEAGITIVTAAGNSWNKGGKKLLPKRVLYPARWDRVIAATGVTSNHLPYVFKAHVTKKSEGGETMQGNFGPKSAMKSAIAAYTPNTPWPTMNNAKNEVYYRFDGGGTSTATPQIAAAAALWLSFHKNSIESKLNGANDKWKKVEAVKFALFNSADKKTYDQWEKYYGQGILKANEALNIFPDFAKLRKAKEAKTSLNGILDLLGILVRVKSTSHQPTKQLVLNEMYTTEIMQLLHTNPNLHQFLGHNDDELWSIDDKMRIISILLDSNKISSALKDKLMSLIN